MCCAFVGLDNKILSYVLLNNSRRGHVVTFHDLVNEFSAKGISLFNDTSSHMFLRSYSTRRRQYFSLFKTFILLSPIDSIMLHSTSQKMMVIFIAYLESFGSLASILVLTFLSTKLLKFEFVATNQKSSRST
jgi:hypothetical protein